MKRKASLYFAVLIAIVLFWIRSFLPVNNQNNGQRSFRNISHLILTKHVICRMGCRHNTEEEIKEILENGKVNYRKSGVDSKGDSTFALEGYSNGNQHIRLIVASGSDGLVIITCIDLEHDWPCNCY